MQTFNLIAYNNATFRWTLDVSRLSDFFAAGGVLHMTGTFPPGTSYEWIQGAASGGIINVSSAAGVYTALFTAPLKDTSLWFGKMTFDCRGELPSGAAIPIMSGAIDFRQGKTRRLGDASSTSISTIYDTVEGSAPALVLPVDWTATLNAARGYASDAAASAASAASMAALAAASVGGSTTFRNRLINGNFDVWQRGTSIVVPDWSLNYYTADRWIINNLLGVSATVSKVGAPTGFRGAQALNVQATGVAASAYVDIAQRVEARNVADLDSVACVMSLDISASTSSGSLFAVAILITNVAPDDGTYSMVTASSAVTIPVGGGTVAVPFTASQTVGIKNGIDLRIRIQQNSTAGNPNITVGAAQLEADPSGAGNASPFEFRPLPVELAMCQRYYQTGAMYFIGSVTSGSYYGAMAYLPVPMRATPTLAQTDGGGASGFPTTTGSFAVSTQSFRSQRLCNATTANGGYNETYTLSAEL